MIPEIYLNFIDTTNEIIYFLSKDSSSRFALSIHNQTLKLYKCSNIYPYPFLEDISSSPISMDNLTSSLKKFGFGGRYLKLYKIFTQKENVNFNQNKVHVKENLNSTEFNLSINSLSNLLYSDSDQSITALNHGLKANNLELEI